MRIERSREIVKGAVNWEAMRQKAEAGWRLVAVEWAREAEGEEHEFGEIYDYVPYGLRVASDCLHLEENPEEMQVLMLMMELIVQDHPLSKVAEELNRRGYRTRQGWQWSPVSVFNLLARLIEVGPRIFSSEEWAQRRKRLFQIS